MLWLRGEVFQAEGIARLETSGGNEVGMFEGPEDGQGMECNR